MRGLPFFVSLLACEAWYLDANLHRTKSKKNRLPAQCVDNLSEYCDQLLWKKKKKTDKINGTTPLHT